MTSYVIQYSTQQLATKNLINQMSPLLINSNDNHLAVGPKSASTHYSSETDIIHCCDTSYVT